MDGTSMNNHARECKNYTCRRFHSFKNIDFLPDTDRNLVIISIYRIEFIAHAIYGSYIIATTCMYNLFSQVFNVLIYKVK